MRVQSGSVCNPEERGDMVMAEENASDRWTKSLGSFIAAGVGVGVERDCVSLTRVKLR